MTVAAAVVVLGPGCMFLRDFSAFEEGACTPEGAPPEICNGVDDDCNGTVDDFPIECSVANGTTACVDGGCGFGGCNAGFADCDGDGTSCEVATDYDRANCGACGSMCSDVQTCIGGACRSGTVESFWFGGSTLLDTALAIRRSGPGDLYVGLEFNGTITLPGGTMVSAATNTIETVFLKLGIGSGLPTVEYYPVSGVRSAACAATQTTIAPFDIVVAGAEVGFVFHTSSSDCFDQLSLARADWDWMSAGAPISGAWFGATDHTDTAARGLFVGNGSTRDAEPDGMGGFFVSVWVTPMMPFSETSNPANTPTTFNLAATASYLFRMLPSGGPEVNPVGSIRYGIFPRKLALANDGTHHLFVAGGLSDGSITPETGPVVRYANGADHETPVLGYWDIDSRTLVWARDFPCTTPEANFLSCIVPDATGGLFFFGSCNGTANVGGHSVTGQYLGHAQPDGTVDWARSTGSGMLAASDLAFFEDTLFAVFDSDDTMTSVDLGIGPITTHGGTDIVIGAYDAATGATRWAHVIGSAGDERVNAMAVERSGANLVFNFAGSMNRTVDFHSSTSPYTSVGGADAMVLRYLLPTQ